jgi:predicted TIM-barrel fold metal-dependent hydrolase
MSSSRERKGEDGKEEKKEGKIRVDQDDDDWKENKYARRRTVRGLRGNLIVDEVDTYEADLNRAIAASLADQPMVVDLTGDEGKFSSFIYI